MEALSAVGLTPIPVLSDRRIEPRKISSLPLSSLKLHPLNFPKAISRNFHGGPVLLSSVFSAGFARALTYEEALQQSPITGIPSDFEVGGLIDSVSNFVVENPTVVAGGAAILVVPLVLSQLFGKSKPWGIVTAKNAYAKLGDDANAQLLDIRALVDLRQVGGPDIKGLSKKPVSIVYKGEDKRGFLKKLASKFKEPENTTLFILDKFDGSSELVAELVTANGFKAAYAIKDGAEGTRGWMNSGLPWIQPNKTFSFDVSSLTDAIDGTLGEGSDAVSVALGVAAATGLGLFAFTEAGTLLQVLGSAALVQFISKKLLFAEDRKQTLQQIDEFVTTKVAPKELVDEIKEIGKALLPTPVTSKALPAPAEASGVATDSTVQKAEAVRESDSAPPTVEAAAESGPEVDSVPQPEVKAESFPGISRLLSPFPYYPDFKPPTSPTPSKP